MHRRAQEHAGGNHRQAQQGDRCGSRRPRDEGTLCRPGQHGASRITRDFGKLIVDETEKQAKVIRAATIKAE
jgi:hypothetical protein